jgi:HEAT repeat protein/cyclophilin family peptidyl-prolyl cis-trans isomerase
LRRPVTSKAVWYDCDLQVDLAKRHEAKVTIVCMALLALAAGYLLLTRPSHRIEGDFLQREDARAADEWLFAQLETTVAEQRARACLALGRIGDPATLPHLLNALKDHAASVRAAAAFAVGRMEDAETVAESGRQPRREAADALLVLLEDEERAVAANAVEALGKLGFADVAGRLTETAAPHPVTLTALVRLGAVEWIPWIAERLKSDDQDNRWAAALALNTLNAPVDDGIARSFLNLTKDRETIVRIEAVAGLARAQPSQAIPSQEIFDALVRMTSDPDPKVRLAALGSLGALRHAGTLELLVESLRDRNENVAAAAIRAMAELGDRRAMQMLDPLRFRASVVSYQAEAALAGLAGDSDGWIEGLWPLPETYRSPAGVQGVAAALGRAQSARSLEVLREMWRDTSPAIQAARPAILQALHQRAAPNLEGYLSEALASPDRALQRAAREWTPGRGSRDHVGTTSPKKPHYESGDYQRIARTMGHRVRLETSAGPIEIALDYHNAALTAEYFVGLAGKGTLDGARFASVTPDRYLEVGIPRRNAPDDPEAQPGEDTTPATIPAEINAQPFLRGSVGMTATALDAEASRFFICLTPQPLANGRHTNFGRLVSGDDLLDAITVETRILKATVVE